jgi:hypothetical protein
MLSDCALSSISKQPLRLKSGKDFSVQAEIAPSGCSGASLLRWLWKFKIIAGNDDKIWTPRAASTVCGPALVRLHGILY